MSEKHISVADVKARFAAVLDDVLHRGQRYVIERHGREVAAIVGLAELKQLDRARPERPVGPIALVGLWHDVADEDIDAFVDDVRAARDRDTGRNVEVGA